MIFQLFHHISPHLLLVRLVRRGSSSKRPKRGSFCRRTGGSRTSWSKASAVPLRSTASQSCTAPPPTWTKQRRESSRLYIRPFGRSDVKRSGSGWNKIRRLHISVLLMMWIWACRTRQPWSLACGIQISSWIRTRSLWKRAQPQNGLSYVVISSVFSSIFQIPFCHFKWLEVLQIDNLPMF